MVEQSFGCHVRDHYTLRILFRYLAPPSSRASLPGPEVVADPAPDACCGTVSGGAVRRQRVGAWSPAKTYVGSGYFPHSAVEKSEYLA